MSSTVRQRLILSGVLLLAAFLRFWNLGQNGFGNLYYAAAVRSMRVSVSNFLFAAYDPAGFVSVDKPPLALHLQTLSTAVFGYHGLALLLPQAAAGTLAVYLLYRLVRADFGEGAGLLSAFCLAITPIAVATDRMNLPDGLLSLTLIAASSVFLKSIRSGDSRALLLAALLFGVGFQIKMWEALIFTPVLAILYLVHAPHTRKERLIRLTMAAIVLCAVAFSWVLFIDSIAPAQRPYVGGSRNNSAIDLIFVYNGWDRLCGGADQLNGNLLAPGGELAGLGSTPGFWAGPPGLFRLFQHALGPQLMWWFGTLIGGVWLLVASWPDYRKEQRIAIGMLSGWVGCFAIVFSAANGTMHPYYVSVMAPALAALAGVCIAEACRSNRPCALFIVLFGGALLQGGLLYSDLVRVPALLLCPLLAGIVAIGTLVKPARRLSCLLTIALLSCCPLYWSWTAVAVRGNALVPSTGPEILAGAWRYPPPENPKPFTRKLIQFLQANHGTERFLFATGSVYNASPVIIHTGKPVMALGGFLGSDPILAPGQLGRYVERGELRFLLLTPSDALPGNTYLPMLAGWAVDHCQVVDPAQWQEYAPGYSMEAMTLYDCKR